MVEFLHSPYAVPLGAFAVAITALIMGGLKKMKAEELRHDRDMREKEMAHQLKLKQMDTERARSGSESLTQP